MIKLISKLWRRRKTPPEERIEELREYKGHLKRQLRKTDQQIDEAMLQRIREAGLGA